MFKLSILLLLIGVLTCTQIKAQDTLPRVSAKNIDNRIIISWKNNYDKPIANISIQRSFDSLKNYTTIGTVLNPQNKENGFADVRPPYVKMYYRVFVAFEGCSYIYSNTVRPVKDTSTKQLPPITIPITVIEPPRPSGWIPSKHIFTTFTSKDSYVTINLPDAATKKYSVKFYDESDQLVFELTKIPDVYLTLEKVNFVHSGWFQFELYESGLLMEKNKFFVPKDGKNQQLPAPVEQIKKNK